MDSFTIELVSKASFYCYSKNSLCFFLYKFFNQSSTFERRMGICYFKNIIPFLYQNSTEGKFTFVDGRKICEEKRKIEPMLNEPRFYSSIVDRDGAINNKNRECLGAHAFEDNKICVSLDKTTQENAVLLL